MQTGPRWEFSIVNLDPELKDLIPGYLERRRQDVQAIRAALGSGDFRTIEILGHRLKGNAGNFGLAPLGEIGAALEGAARDGNRGEVERAFERYEHFLGNLDTNLH